jgi:PAS domain S-box-containing protein
VKRVIIIDDDHQDQGRLLRLLRDNGYSVSEGGGHDEILLKEAASSTGLLAGGMAVEKIRGADSGDGVMVDVQPTGSSSGMRRTLQDFPAATLVSRAADGTVLDGNHPFVQLSGYDRDEMIGQNVLTLFFFLDPELWTEAFRRVEREGEVRDLETRMWTKDGLVRFVAVSLRREDIDGVSCHVISIRRRMANASATTPDGQRPVLTDGVPESLLAEEADFDREEVGRLIDFQALQDLMNSFYKITRIGIGINDIKGNVQVATGWQDVCTKFFRIHPETLKNCLESDIHLSRKLGQGEALYKCRHGMWELATPLVIGGRHIANIFLGQFFFEGEVPDYGFFRAQAEAYGFDAEEFMAALERVPRWSRELVQDVMEFYKKLAVMISRLSIGNIQLSQTLEEQKRISEELRQAKLVVESSPVVLFRWRAEEGWPVELVSDNVSRFGYSRDELLSGSVLFSTLVHPDDLRQVTAEVGEYTAKGIDSFQQEYRLVSRDGAVRWIDDRTVIERDAAGRVIHYQGTVIDISERKMVEEKLRLTQYCVDNAAVDIFLVVPGEAKIIYVNEHLCRSTGYTREELYCLTVLDLDPFTTRERLEELDRQFLANGSIQPFEGHMRRKDGTFFPVEISASNISFEGKELALCFALDISERRRAEEALRKSDERMRLYFERQLVGMAITSPEKGWLQVNDKLCRMLGYEREELIRLTWDEMTHPDDLVADEACFQRLMKGEIDDYSLEKRFIRKDGATVYTNLSVGCVRTEGGTVDYVLALLEDISDRKRAEEELRQSENKVREIFENAPIGIFRSTRDGKFISVNPATARLLKYDSPEEMIETVNRRGIAETLYMEPEQRHDLVQELQQHADWKTLEVRYRCKDGSAITCNFYIRRVPGPDGALSELEGFVEDITDRKNTEEALRESEERLRSIFRVAPVGIGVVRDRVLLEVNRRLCDMTGYGREELIGENAQILYPDREEFERVGRIKYRQIEEKGTGTIETRWRRKNGSVIDILLASTPLHPSDLSKGVTFTALDITERKQTEGALRESEEKFRVLAETLPAAIMLHQGGKFIYANPATSLITGYSETELLGMNFWEWCREEDWDTIRERGHMRLRGRVVPNQYEYRMITKSGEEKWVMVSAGTTDYRGRATIIATLLDITEAKRAEERIQTALAEKIVLLKEVHHRVKNNLQIISSLLDLQSDSIPDEQSRGYFRESQNRVRSMALVHEQIYKSKDFSSIDFSEYIRDLAQCLFDSYAVGSGRISLRLSGADVTLGINEAIPCGLIVNELVSNALKHAFPARGSGEISVDTSVENGWINLRVADTGTGLPAGLDFRNTTSLGLQLVTMLVRQLRGRLVVDGGQGGTAVAIAFPASAQVG